MIGKTVSHYKIIEKLGEGGMGEVYLADDLKLDRKVAIKFLPEHLTKDKENVERFEREAKAIAALNHPNIVSIYDIAEEDSQSFIVMEYVDGDSLRTRIDKEISELDKILDITKQICDGLSEAHKAGIVHRDIKPENILIDNSGRVKILDFGLAKLRGVSKLTKESSTVGTIHYMSPEQYQNKKVNHQTDIWSFGVVLFEMLTGKLPFEGDYEAGVMYSVVNEEPVTIYSIRRDTPQYLEKIVRKSLEKDPAMRYQSVLEILGELKPMSSFAVTEKQEKSIVVLPFDDMSPDKNNEYFSDGLTEEIITDLSHIHDLLVISCNSAMTFKGTNKKTKEIAKEVNVQYVLEGSVRKVGNNLRITAQLIDANTDVHLWAEKYSGTIDDVFDIQEKVSRSIVDGLSLRLGTQESKGLGEKPIKNVHAYDCYLRARYDIESYTKEGFDRALQHLYNGLDMIGENALIYAGIGYTYWNYANQSIGQEECVDKAEKYARKALELTPDSAEAHLVLGVVYMAFRGDQKRAFYHLTKSLASKSDDPHTLSWTLLAHYIVGKLDAFMPLVERSMQLDPLNPMIRWLPAGIDLGTGRFDRAAQFAWDQLPSTPGWVFMNALALVYAQRFDNVRNLISKSVRAEWDDVFASLCRFINAAIERKTERMEELMTGDCAKTCHRDPSWSYWVASIFALAEKWENTLTWLTNAIDRGFINYHLLNEFDPFLENIRSEERFQKLMKRVKKEWENFEV
jgi:non-specific serine/threonine protein kinase